MRALAVSFHQRCPGLISASGVICGLSSLLLSTSAKGERLATGDEREAQGTTGRKKAFPSSLARPLCFQQRDVWVRGSGLSLLMVFVFVPRSFLRVVRLSSFHKYRHSTFHFDQVKVDEEPLSRYCYLTYVLVHISNRQIFVRLPRRCACNHLYS